MSPRFALPAGALLLAPVLAAPSAPAPPQPKLTDWTMFGGTPARNMVNLTDRVSTDFDPETGDGILWRAALGSRSYGGPTVVGGKIFVGTNGQNPRNNRDVRVNADGDVEAIDRGILMCLDRRTGKFLWQAVHDKLPSGTVNDWPEEGVCSTPTVEGDRVYYVSNRCTVVCADANGRLNGVQGKPLQFADPKTKKPNPPYDDDTDADVLWEYDMIRELKVFPHNMSMCSPLIVGDILFVCTSNGVGEDHIKLPSPDAPSFIALDKNTGKLLWKSNVPGKSVMHGQWAFPSYGEIDGVRQVIFPGGDGWLYSFVPETGELIWKFDCNPKDAVYELGGTGTRNDFVNCAPVIADGRVYIGVGQDPEHTTGIANFFCLAPKKDKKGDVSKVLEARGRDPIGQEVIGEKPNPNSIEVWRYGWVEERKWAPRDFRFGRTMSNACVVDGVVYIAELHGYLHCLDAKTGKHFWTFDTKGEIWGSAYHADGKIFLGTSGSELFIFRHDQSHEVMDDVAAGENAPNQKAARVEHKKMRAAVEKKYLLRKVELDAPIRTTPVVAGGVLYVMTEKSLYAIGKR